MKLFLPKLLLFWLISEICAKPTRQSGLIKRKTADDLGTPECDGDRHCAVGGTCRDDGTGKKHCMCSASCYLTVPLKCAVDVPHSCVTMGENYVSKYNVSVPYCYHGRCVCPPQYDPLPVKQHTPGFTHMPPMKCDKRELKIMVTVSPADSVYKGTEATIYCCINQDPRDFVADESVMMIQNGTRNRVLNTTPYEMFSGDEDALFAVPTCWSLTISNVQSSDSGTYTCFVQPKSALYSTQNQTVNFTVKTPRMIQNVTIIPNATQAIISWDTQEGPMLKIDIRVFKRTSGKRQIFSADNIKSPILLTQLEPATSYTIFMTVQDGQMVPFELTEQFQSLDGQSDPPQIEDIRLTNTMSGLQCEVEWRAPHISNGQILKYYVQLKGKLRYRPDYLDDSEVDFPLASEPCVNYDGTNEDKSIDAKLSFFSCKFGPLKPNRNYTATIWAENQAGKSLPVTFSQQCSMDFAEPEEVETPESSNTQNVTSFSLKFTKTPKETNGPIACYYLAIIPLPGNASVQKLPKPNEIVMDTFEAAMLNNVKSVNEKYFAYITESYLNFPKETIVGDNKLPSNVEPCNALYLSRYKATDMPLQPDLKYTGFLVVRVDRDSKLHPPNYDRTIRLRKPRKKMALNLMEVGPRFSRQLTVSDPAYGFSGYFKPVYLQSNSIGTTSAFQVFGFVFLALLFLMLLAGSVLYFLYKKGLIHHLCPNKKSHHLLRQAYQPIPVEDLVNEFIIRHRDSDFLFTSEFDSLPKPVLPCVTCDKKENERKNRYHDIKACDETRVKLKTNSLDGSDYINANFIKGYANKKTFIAAQAPMENTMNDFWKMIWEQDVRIVIMAANINERGRKQAYKYWPNDDEENLFVNENLEISCKKTDVFADFSRREFDLTFVSLADREMVAKKMPEPESDYANLPLNRPNSKNLNKLLDDDSVNKEVRKVIHYHFTTWVDLKAPESTCGILRLMLKLRKMDEYLNHPVLIHCSAGVGRTGTFIAIDTLMDQCINEGKADVYATVTAIRQQRNCVMVQTMEQYAFIYRALAEHFYFGDTDVSADNFCDHYARLRYIPRERKSSGTNGIKMTSIAVSYDQNGGSTPPSTITANHGMTTSSVSAAWNAKVKQWKNGIHSFNKETKQSGLEREYEVLFTVFEPIRTTSAAHKDDNMSKNRFPDVVPYDRYRIMLIPRIGCSSSSQYINATPHRGYWQNFVMAQDPLNPETCHDFWRMVDDGRSRILVMLSREEDFLPGEKYWPEQVNTSIHFGRDDDLTVTLISERIYPTFIERRIQYKFKREEEICEITQMAFTEWTSGATTPASPGPLRDLALKIITRQNKLVEPGPVIVHSRDGSSEPAIFVALASLLERFNVEKMVDVFRTCRAILQHRPRVFTKIEQYIFIYDTIADYIRSF